MNELFTYKGFKVYTKNNDIFCSGVTPWHIYAEKNGKKYGFAFLNFLNKVEQQKEIKGFIDSL